MAQLAEAKATGAKQKQALDKALREKGEITKALRAKQTAEERATEEKEEAERRQLSFGFDELQPSTTE